jgi:glycosyltransferase involved in cell wall biosynthesis
MKVSIIIRAFNRLEYTIQCINSVINNSGYKDFEIIVINQGSTDGTKEWLDWITKMPNKWYEKVKPMHLKRNVGDFGGMKIGFTYSSGDIVMQLDNDIYMETENWLDKMVYVFNKINANILMANRKGIRQKLPIDINTIKNIQYKKNILTCAKTSNAVACYLIKREIFDQKYKSAKRCRHITTDDNCWKLLEVFGNHIEGYNPETESYIQEEKYNFLFKKQFLSKKFIFKHGIRR